jgi:diguanylate cyclase (GGDEF)-like protein
LPVACEDRPVAAVDVNVPGEKATENDLLPYALFKKLTAVALPAALLIATFVVLQRIRLLPAAQREMASNAPYLALSVALALSLAFNRGRVFLAVAMVAAFHLLERNLFAAGIEEPGPHILYHCLSLIIPVNLVLFTFMRERGIFTPSGRIRCAFLAAQAGVVYWMVRFRHDYSGLTDLLGRRIISSSFLDRFILPQFSLLLFVLAGGLITVRVLKRRYPIDVALLGTLVALGISLSRIQTDFLPTLFVTAALLLLTIGVLQDSHNMAFSDDLTGLPSRRALNEQVMGLGRRYVVAMVDVDHFKRFNDTYGHDVGDQVLKMVGAKIAGVKGGGRPYRYGGEEFTVIFPRKDLNQVTAHLEELRQAISSYQLSIRGSDRPKEADLGKSRRNGGAGSGKTVSVTVSIGVAASGEQMRTPTEVIKAADKALYRAKQRGRNQIAI